MKIAFISDIHGNATALEAVLTDIEKKQADKIVVLGDIAYRGPEPKKSLDLVRNLNTEVIKGNADEWVHRGINEGEVPDQALDMMKKEQEWTISNLSAEDLEYLRNLPVEVEVDLTEKIKVHCFHATPDSVFEVVKPAESDRTLEEKLMTNKEAHIFLYGHIHLPYVRHINGKCVANLGSVGLPFDGLNHASYLIAEGDGEQFNIGVQRVQYDVEKVKKQLEENEYPNLEFLSGIIERGALPQ
ncbi:metallophosphoesterase family protein [Salinicoccus halodurans]|uniref:Phosphodiesterase n=1 Tax=Salinicoccus halodurans TaxID=407035 RepID=A0A0F7HL01_9STAP|nr:metallophosphoesterase family protein [Salinicoccus halodurans]AKG73899.1 phosphodiesterase [Salinicoccus halodurans]SFK57458.1 phosphoesterase, MJ0936 family [Salinicoccus halodurans]